VPVLHTHAEILETESLPPTLAHFVGSAEQTRAGLEREMAVPELRLRWYGSDTHELVPATVQFGAVQYADGRILLGQVSRAVPGFLDGPRPDGEGMIRAAARVFFPALADAPGRMRGRPVAISVDRLPVAGALADLPNLFVASGFDSPVIYAPALARRLAAAIAGQHVPELEEFSPDRMGTADARSPSRRG
jgi:glycine/D-amino acid oxidase-like deaminating enzyme